MTYASAHTTGISLPSLSFNDGGNDCFEAEVTDAIVEGVDCALRVECCRFDEGEFECGCEAEAEVGRDLMGNRVMLSTTWRLHVVIPALVERLSLLAEYSAIVGILKQMQGLQIRLIRAALAIVASGGW